MPDYPTSSDAMDAFVEAGLKSNVVIPLTTANQSIGVLAASGFNRHQRERPHSGLLRRVERIAAQIAVASHRAALEARLRALASTDPLTGVASCRGITPALDDKVARYQRLGR
ncbi:MAG: GAF domain-containing protein, partial [Halofilum sp. (in: g-proteobacteria)]